MLEVGDKRGKETVGGGGLYEGLLGVVCILKSKVFHCWAYYLAFSGICFSSGMIVLTRETHGLILMGC